VRTWNKKKMFAFQAVDKNKNFVGFVYANNPEQADLWLSRSEHNKLKIRGRGCPLSFKTNKEKQY